MTTEGDGNYQLQRFLESEGAECDIQLVTAWLLYMIWEARARHEAAHGSARRRQGQVRPRRHGPVRRRRRSSPASARREHGHPRRSSRRSRTRWASTATTCRTWTRSPRSAHEYYNNDLRGGEGHMEVGKLIMNVVQVEGAHDAEREAVRLHAERRRLRRRAVAITEKFPGTIFCPVETSGDGRVNFYSRVQMYLFKAKQAAHRRVRARARRARRDARAGARVPRREPALREPAPQGAAHVRGQRRRTSSPRSRRYITKTRAERLRERVDELRRALEGARAEVAAHDREPRRDHGEGGPRGRAAAPRGHDPLRETRRAAKEKASRATEPSVAAAE